MFSVEQWRRWNGFASVLCAQLAHLHLEGLLAEAIVMQILPVPKVISSQSQSEKGKGSHFPMPPFLLYKPYKNAHRRYAHIDKSSTKQRFHYSLQTLCDSHLREPWSYFKLIGSICIISQLHFNNKSL